MGKFAHFLRDQFLPASALVSLLMVATAPAVVYGQIVSPCTASMLTSFAPCMNFVTNSTANGTISPTSDCCNSLRSLTRNGTDCLCLIATGANVPFRTPVNRTLVISLPRACNTPGVPLQCKASAAPIPAPGPIAITPTLSPTPSAAAPSPPTPSAAAPSPKGSAVPNPVPPALAPEGGTTPVLTPPSPTNVESGTPPTNSGSRPVLTPSAAAGLSHSFLSPLLPLVLLAVTASSYY